MIIGDLVLRGRFHTMCARVERDRAPERVEGLFFRYLFYLAHDRKIVVRQAAVRVNRYEYGASTVSFSIAPNAFHGVRVCVIDGNSQSFLKKSS